MKMLKKNYLLALIVACFSIMTVDAESEVYVFYPPMFSATPQNSSNRPEAIIGINGEYSISVYGNYKKTFDDPILKFVYPMYYYSGGVQKLVFSEEGKVIITYSFDYINGNGVVSPIRSEIQLDIEDGETYYVELEKKGKILKEKKGKKKLDDKKLFVMPVWIQPQKDHKNDD